MSHFPADFPKDCVVALAQVAMSGDTSLILAPSTVDHAIYASGCLNAMRFDEEKTPVFAATATAVPPFLIALALQLAERIIVNFFSKKAGPQLAMASADDVSSLEIVELGEKLHQALAA